jgi:hypothetical protein
MTSKEWSERLGMYDVRESAHADFWTYCPCHHDQSPRLHVWRVIDGGISMRCQGCGATGSDVCRELGIPERELRGEPMRRHKRRAQVAAQEEADAGEEMYCMACGRPMAIDVWPDIFAGGWFAQARCRAGEGCGIWMTRPVRALGKIEAERVLRESARKSWRRAADKCEDVHPSEIPVGRGWGCAADA